MFKRLMSMFGFMPLCLGFAEDGESGGGGTAYSQGATPPESGGTPPEGGEPPTSGDTPASAYKQGGEQPTFESIFGEEGYKDNPALQGLTDVKSLADKVIELNGLVGSNFKVPGQDATPEEVAAYHRAIGVPDTPEGYEIKTPEGLVEGAASSDEQANWFAKNAHELGIPKPAAQELFSRFNQLASEQMQQSQEAARANGEKLISTLRRELGPTLGDRFNKMHNMVNQYDPSGEINKLLEEGEFGSDERVLRFLLNVSNDIMSEDTQRGQGSDFSVTPDEAKSEIDKIVGDSKSAYWNESDPQHRSVVEKVEKLYDVINKSVNRNG